jgi:spermidine synthase
MLKYALAAIGFTSTLAQIIMMRELVAIFYGNELLLGLVLTAWLAWVAVGSWGLSRCASQGQLNVNSLAAGLILSGVLLPLQIALVRGIRLLIGVTPGAFVEFVPMVGAVVISLAPLCLIVGFLFTLGVRFIVEIGGTAGQAYVWEGIGAVVGGTLLSFILIYWLDAFQIALLVTTVNLVLAGNLLISRPFPRVQRLTASMLSLALLFTASLPLGRTLHETSLHWQWVDLVFFGDSPYGRLTIQARNGQRIFFENGLLAFETQSTFPEEVVHFPMLEHPDPQNILLIGGGMAGDLREILKHPVQQVTYVELDPLLIEAAKNHLPPEDASVLNDEQVDLVLSDGRFFIKEATPSYDVVILDLPEPATGALNRFYTQEFFAEVKAALDTGGIFALGLPSAENYWSPELARRNGSVFYTLREVYPEVLVLPGEHNFYLASEMPLATDPALLAQRLSMRNVETRWVTPGYLDYIFTTDRFSGVQRELEAIEGVRINQDLRPICYYYDLALWLSQFYHNLRGMFEGAGLINLWWIVIPLALIVLLVRTRQGLAIPISIAGIGFAEMTLEVVILFAFQVLHGYLYAEVSLIVTAFMAGLALGGWTSNKLLAIWSSDLGRKSKRALAVVLAAIVIYSGSFLIFLSLPIHSLAFMFPVLALLAGLLTGMAFPLAVKLRRGNAIQSAGMLYGADLVGGCLGALLSAGLFIPILGIPQTCAAVALIGLAGLVMLL